MCRRLYALGYSTIASTETRPRKKHTAKRNQTHTFSLATQTMQKVQSTGELTINLFKLGIDTHEHLVSKCKPSAGEPGFPFFLFIISSLLSTPLKLQTTDTTKTSNQFANCKLILIRLVNQNQNQAIS